MQVLSSTRCSGAIGGRGSGAVLGEVAAESVPACIRSWLRLGDEVGLWPLSLLWSGPWRPNLDVIRIEAYTRLGRQRHGPLE